MKAALLMLTAALGSVVAAHKRHDAFHQRRGNWGIQPSGWVPHPFEPECCKEVVTVTVYGSSMLLCVKIMLRLKTTQDLRKIGSDIKI